MHVVRAIKKFNQITVGNAINQAGYYWKNPKRRPTNVDTMLVGLPRPVLDQVLRICQGSKR